MSGQADYAIDCDSPSYKLGQIYAIIMAGIYPVGIPLVYLRYSSPAPRLWFRRPRRRSLEPLHIPRPTTHTQHPKYIVCSSLTYVKKDILRTPRDERSKEDEEHVEHISFLCSSYKEEYWVSGECVTDFF